MSRRIQSGHCTDALCLAVRTNAFLKTKMCPRLENCSLGKNCSFAHSDVELRPLPEFKKTAICYNFRRGKCIDPGCKFAHGEEDMMGYIPQTAMQPRKICPYYIIGACGAENCMHAHMVSRRAASRLKTFLVALRNGLLSVRQGGESIPSVMTLKKRLKGGIPWQSLGFATFKDAVLFLPGTHFTGDEEHVDFSATNGTRELLQKLQDLIDSTAKPPTTPTKEVPPGFGRSVSSSSSYGEIFTPVRQSLTLPQQLIKPHQILGPHSAFFVCPVCEGLAMDPMITEQCSHVICRLCIEVWTAFDLSKPFICPRCQSLVNPDEISRLSQESPTPTAAALAVIYDSIQVRCESCDWTGSPRNYASHQCCSASSVVTPKSGSFVAVEDFRGDETSSSNLLAVKRGEKLEISAQSDSGWAYVTKPDTHEAGWTPASFLVPE